MLTKFKYSLSTHLKISRKKQTNSRNFFTKSKGWIFADKQAVNIAANFILNIKKRMLWENKLWEKMSMENFIPAKGGHQE
jgi:hypothetical protein